LGGLAALALGGGILALTILTGSPPEVEPPPPPLIEAARAEAADLVSLRQTGFVRPLAEVTLSTEIQGRILDVSESFRRGTFVQAGDVLVRLETRQLRAAVAQARAAIAQAEAALAEARVERDRQEQLEAQEFASEAALQQAIVAVASAEARLTGARADLVSAQSRLDDATIAAPFDALVVEETADPGDVAQPGASLGRLVASEAVEVEFGLTPGDLDLLGEAERAIGGRVVVRPLTAAAPANDPLAVGVVSEVGASVAVETRTVPLIVRIDRPFDPGEGGRPLRIDELIALELQVDLSNRNAVSLPARAVKGGNTVWAIRTDEAETGDADDGGEGEDAQPEAATLVRVTVSVLQRAEDVAVVEGALPAGTLVMLSDLPGAADGARVRLARDQEGSDDGTRPEG
jgi:RND family efflux transporter MFP subunit